MTSTSAQSSNKLLPAYLIVGEDELKQRRTLERLRARVAEQGDLDFNHDIFDAEHASGADVAAACNTIPFASDLRLVELTNVDKLAKADIDVLVAYLSAPSESTVLALISSKLAKNSRIYKSVLDIGKSSIIDCAAPKRFELTKMLRNMAIGYGFSLSEAGAAKLVELVGEDTIHLDQELSKISLAVSSQDSIGPREIESLVARTAETKPWELINAFSERNLKLCLSYLHVINDSPLRLIALFVPRLRELACAKALEQRGQLHLLAQTLGLPDWRVKNHAQWARNYSEAELKQAFISIRDCEKRLKSSSSGDHALEDWIISVVARS